MYLQIKSPMEIDFCKLELGPASCEQRAVLVLVPKLELHAYISYRYCPYLEGKKPTFLCI